MACVQSGSIYWLTNVKSDTCLDLSGGDDRSIIGYGYHGGPNQAWIFQSAGDDRLYYLQSAGGGQYLSVAGEPRDGQKVVADRTRYAWHIEDEPEGNNEVRLSPADNRNFCLDLSDHGNPKWGTPVELWGRWEGKNQVWRLQKL